VTTPAGEAGGVLRERAVYLASRLLSEAMFVIRSEMVSAMAEALRRPTTFSIW
jgi:hypothetical protein